MNQFGMNYIPFSDLFKNPYYNVAYHLMAMEGDVEHLVHFAGEAGAFAAMVQIQEYNNYIRSCDWSSYPVGINNGKMANRYLDLVSALLTEKDGFFFYGTTEEPIDFGEHILGNYEGKQKIIDFWNKIPEKYNLTGFSTISSSPTEQETPLNLASPDVADK